MTTEMGPSAIAPRNGVDASRGLLVDNMHFQPLDVDSSIANGLSLPRHRFLGLAFFERAASPGRKGKEEQGRKRPRLFLAAI